MRIPEFSTVNLILIPCLVLCFIERVNSISCFQCNSHTDEGCELLQQSDTGSHYYKECEEKNTERPTFCRKVHLKVKMKYLAGPIHERIIRSCGWSKDLKRECYRRDDKDHEEKVCQCFHDGCNGSSSLYALPAAVILSTLALWLR